MAALKCSAGCWTPARAAWATPPAFCSPPTSPYCCTPCRLLRRSSCQSFGWRCHSLGQRPSTIELYTSPDGTAYHLHAIINAAAAEPDGVLHRVSTPPLAPTSIFFRVVVLLDGPTRDARDARRATAVILSELALVSDDADGATSVSTPPAPPPPHADSYPLPSALPTFQLPPLPPPQPQPPPLHPPPRPAPVLSAPWPPLLPARTLPSPWGGGIECRLQLVQHTVHTATLLAALQRQVLARPIGASWRPGPRDRHAHHTHTQAQRTHTRAHPPTHLSPTYARWRARKRERGDGPCVNSSRAGCGRWHS